MTGRGPDAEGDDGRARLPAWAARSRRVFRVSCGVFGILGLTGLGVRLLAHLTGLDLRVAEPPDWLPVVALALPAVVAASGLAWLVGLAVAGYREPD